MKIPKGVPKIVKMGGSTYKNCIEVNFDYTIFVKDEYKEEFENANARWKNRISEIYRHHASDFTSGNVDYLIEASGGWFNDTIRRFRSQLKTLLVKFRDVIITNASEDGYEIQESIETTDNAIAFIKKYS